jgi:acetyl/propionyl-CoA carboxylase alpha subunit
MVKAGACAGEPFKRQYDALIAKGITAALARSTVTRKLTAAITLAVLEARGVRKHPEVFCCNLIMRRSRSAKFVLSLFHVAA